MPEVAVGAGMSAAGHGFQTGGPAILDGEPVDTVLLEQTSGYTDGALGPDKSLGTLTLWISRRDHLLRQIRQEWRQKGGQSVTTETYTDVKTNPVLPLSTFVFTPPANSLVMDSVASLIPPHNVIGLKLHLGDSAPAAAFSRADTSGKPVKLSDYQGKVVLMDFWATWCGLCLAQMPATVAAYRKYHGQGLEIIGYALEQARNAGKMPAFAKRHGMAWREVWDKDASIASACGPNSGGIPFVIVLGRDGKIAALGNPGDDLDVSAAVKAALAKP